jgi:hypothetical protein
VRSFTTRVLLFALSAAALAGCSKNPIIQIPPSPPARLIVADINNDQLLALTMPLGPASAPTTTLTGAVGGFTSAHHIDNDAQGNIYLPDSNANKILIFPPPLTSTSTASVTIGPITGGIFPNSVTIDASGNLWAADGNANDVYEFVPPFTSGAQAPAFTINGSVPAMNIPVSPSFDRAGNMYVAQENLNQFFVYLKPFTPAPTAAAVITIPNLPNPPYPVRTCGPAATTMDKTDHLFVSCAGDGSVRIFGPPYATGNNEQGFIPPFGGSFNAATLKFDSVGNLYVAYTDIGTIAVYSPPVTSSSVPAFTLTTGLGGPFGIAFSP